MKKQKFAAILAFLVMITSLFSGCVAKLPIPDIKKGRFDFSVTYEINGEEKTYSGVYVCEFDGVLTTLVGSTREWKGYIENEKEIDIPIQTNKDGVVYINFGFIPEYFMGDPDATYYEAPQPNLYMIYNSSNPEDWDITGEEEVIAKYGVKLIGYEYAAPIENTFKEKTVSSRFELSIN